MYLSTSLCLPSFVFLSFHINCRPSYINTQAHPKHPCMPCCMSRNPSHNYQGTSTPIQRARYHTFNHPRTRSDSDTTPTNDESPPKFIISDVWLEVAADKTFFCSFSDSTDLIQTSWCTFKVPLGMVPLGKVPLGKVPLALGRVPLGKVPLGKVPLGKVPLGKVPLDKVQWLGFKVTVHSSFLESSSLKSSAFKSGSPISLTDLIF